MLAHVKKLAEARAKIDNIPPSPERIAHYKHNVKKKMTEQLRQGEIHHENMRLVERMAVISRRQSKSPLHERPNHTAPSYTRRKQVQQEISRINQKIGSRIAGASTHYPLGKMKQEVQVYERARRVLSRHPANRNPKQPVHTARSSVVESQHRPRSRISTRSVRSSANGSALYNLFSQTPYATTPYANAILAQVAPFTAATMQKVAQYPSSKPPRRQRTSNRTPSRTTHAPQDHHGVNSPRSRPVSTRPRSRVEELPTLADKGRVRSETRPSQTTGPRPLDNPTPSPLLLHQDDESGSIHRVASRGEEYHGPTAQLRLRARTPVLHSAMATVPPTPLRLPAAAGPGPSPKLTGDNDPFDDLRPESPPMRRKSGPRPPTEPRTPVSASVPISPSPPHEPKHSPAAGSSAVPEGTRVFRAQGWFCNQHGRDRKSVV